MLMKKDVIALVPTLRVAGVVTPSEAVAVHGTLAVGIVAGVEGEASVGAGGGFVARHVDVVESAEYNTRWVHKTIYAKHDIVHVVNKIEKLTRYCPLGVGIDTVGIIYGLLQLPLLFVIIRLRAIQ